MVHEHWKGSRGGTGQSFNFYDRGDRKWHQVWIANPLDAFAMSDQRLYLDWLDAVPAGDRLLREGSVVLVARGSPPDRRLAADSSFRCAGADAHARIYVRRASGSSSL